MQGLKRELKGNVSETTLEFYKKQKWLVPDHFTPDGIARYTLASVNDAKMMSVQAHEKTNAPRSVETMLTPKEAFRELEIELGLKPKDNIHKKRSKNGKTIPVHAQRSQGRHEQRVS